MGRADETGPGPIRGLVDEICEVVGPRPSGSEAERRAAEIVRARLEDAGLEAAIETFPVPLRSLHAFLAALVGLHLAALALWWLSPVASLAGVVALLLLLAAHRGLGLDPLAPLLRPGTGTNVVGRLRPRGETRAVLVLGGHHDSAYRMPLLRSRAGTYLLVALALTLALGVVALGALSVWRLVAPSPALVEPIGLALAGLGAVAGLGLAIGVIRGDAVPGANDNLTAVAVSVAAAERLARSGLEHTELLVLSFGAEEAGLVGSRAFVRRHGPELSKALVLNFESLGQRGTLRVLTGELMAGVRHSATAVSLVEAAARAAGIELRASYLPGGLTDAASFSRARIPATTLIRLDEHGLLEHYHSLEDDPASVREEHLEEALRLCLEVADALEASGRVGG